MHKLQYKLSTPQARRAKKYAMEVFESCKRKKKFIPFDKSRAINNLCKFQFKGGAALVFVLGFVVRAGGEGAHPGGG